MLKQAEKVSILHLSKLPGVWSMRFLLCEPSQGKQTDKKACVAPSNCLATWRPAVYSGLEAAPARAEAAVS